MPTKRTLHKEPSVLDAEVKTVYLPNGDLVLTRRHFLYGALGVAGVAALAKGGTALYESQKPSDEIPVLTVREDQVTLSDNLKEAKVDSMMVMTGNYKLKYGTLVWASDDTVAACLVPGETAKPLTQGVLLFLGSGDTATVLKQAVGQDEGFEIYDIRATKKGVIWTEADILDGTWRVFAAKQKNGTLGKPKMLAEGATSDWETPTLAATGKYGYWQVLPNPDGPCAREDSYLMKAVFGSAEGTTVITSHGRMCTSPSSGEGFVVVTPRAETDSTNYAMTCIDAATDAVLDSCTLPQSMKPLEVGYGVTGFNFSFDAIYNYGDGISQMGTYTPLTWPDDRNYDNASWLRFTRSPSAPASWCGPYFMVKSTTAVVAIDPQNATYCVLKVLSGADTYGDYLASMGARKNVVTFTNINHKPIGGKEEICCRVRVFEPVSSETA